MPLLKYVVRLIDEEQTHLDDLIHMGTRRAAATLIHARILLKADVGLRPCIGCVKPLWRRGWRRRCTVGSPVERKTEFRPLA